MKRILFLLLAIFMLVGCSKIEDDPVPEEKINYALCDSGFKVICLNVGKGDAFILRTPDSTVLIDTGYTINGNDICDMLLEAGVKKLDALITTHFDKDHCGGAAQVIRYFNIDRVIQPAIIEQGDEYSSYELALVNKNQEPEIVTEPISFTISGVSYEILPTKKDYDDKIENNTSLVVRAVYGSKVFLFMADVEGERLRDLRADMDFDPICDYLKVPYHGEYFEDLDDFFPTTNAKYGVITCSDAQKEDKKTVKRLTSAGIVSYLTRYGTVVAECDGQNIKMTQYSGT